MRRHFWHPKYWGIWIGFGLLRALSFLPFSQRLAVGAWLGGWLYYLAPRRRKLAAANLALALPELSDAQRQTLNRQHFQNLGRGLAETATNIWGIHRHHPQTHPKHEYHRFHYQGLAHLQHQPEQGKLLVVPHFTTLEATGLMLSQITPLAAIYRPHDNPLMEALITSSRTNPKPDTTHPAFGHAVEPIANTHTRQIIKRLRQGQNVMILPDQRYRGKGRIQAPFFGHDALSHPGLLKLAQLGKAAVLPVFTYREQGQYFCEIQPPLTDFPSKDPQADILRLHQRYEQAIRAHPAQYLWTHNRWNLKRPRDY